MLDPDRRQVYTDALQPPAGFQFTQGIGTTYSLDLETLLTIPLHLALFSANQPVEELLRDGVALLESIRRTADKLTVFVQGSRVTAPTQTHTLFPLLEKTVVEVLPPNRAGSFHPKLWLLQFDNPDTWETRVRLLILSRNITKDRCWDLVLTLEGEPQGGFKRANRPLHDFLTALPDLALQPMGEDPVWRLEELADFARKTPWEVPGDFDEIRFHYVGLGGKGGWRPPDSDRLVVISPFLSKHALESLIESTWEPIGLVSRPEELEAIDPGILDRFERVMVLADRAELEDGEEAVIGGGDIPSHGLHAKAYLIENGAKRHFFVGSANATAPAILSGANVEILAELIGRRRWVGSLEDIFSSENLGGVLIPFTASGEPDDPDPEVEAARAALEAARRTLVSAGLTIRFQEVEDGWIGRVQPKGPFTLEDIGTLEAWLVTRKETTRVSADALTEGRAVDLPVAPISLVTSFLVIEIHSDKMDESLRFVLNLPTENLPVAERDAAIVRDVIRNRDGFLRYVMMLLAEVDEGHRMFGSGSGTWARFTSGRGGDEFLPLFEHLTKAFCRDPDRLHAIRQLLQEVGQDGQGGVVPSEFLKLWGTFEAALGEKDGAAK